MSFLPFTRPSLDEETIRGVVEVLRSGWLTSGPQVDAFEAALSEWFGGRPVRVFNSGTAALEVALALAGIGPGDEVITTPLTWVATANAIVHAGAKPVLVDVDPATRNIDCDRIEAAVGERTRAVIPVDLAGRRNVHPQLLEGSISGRQRPSEREDVAYIGVSRDPQNRFGPY